jgi:2-iminobutanoate/2-iminopropanoate deaminase
MTIQLAHPDVLRKTGVRLMSVPVVTDEAALPTGPYSQGTIARGRMLFVAAQGPVVPGTREFVLGDFEAQATLTFRNVQAVVEAAGATLASAVKVGVFLADIADFDAMNAVYERFFPEPRPARTTVQADLGGAALTVDAIVALDA